MKNIFEFDFGRRGVGARNRATAQQPYYTQRAPKAVARLLCVSVPLRLKCTGILLTITIFLSSFSAKAFNPPTRATAKIQEQVFAITKVMFHDVTDPAAAARFYSYCTLTGYEILYQQRNHLPNIQKLFSHYPVINQHINPKNIDIEFAALYGILETGKAILPSGYLLEENEKKLYEEFAGRHIPSAILDSSVSFAKNISQSIVQYSKEDGYFRLSTFQRYKPLNTDSSWQPTPPEYMPAVQPNWSTMRPFFLDSARQFRPHPLVSFSKDKNSAFFQLALDVYNVCRHLTKEQTLIANFWDCNPFAVQFQGHMSIGLKKISPGGHWMGITGIVCRQRKLDFDSTMFIHTIVALSLHDAFISCWTEKYSSNRIRPETVINRYIDEKWVPVLQTPPFPEYTSGHSVISTTAAFVLTHFLGNHFSFVDSTEIYIGLAPRHFSSFINASDEACISRLYGGIHFRDSIENGKDEGEHIAAFIISQLEKLNGE